jgi:hypothetical protein
MSIIKNKFNMKECKNTYIIKKNSKMQSIYVFIGHGWNTMKTLKIEKAKNIEIVMLKDSFTLFENHDNNHKQLLSKVGINGFTEKNYLQTLKSWSDEYKNIFSTYNSDKYQIVPDLLLTTYTKNSNECNGYLQKVGNVSSIKIKSEVLMLSDIIKELDGKFILILYVCRSQLDEWQIKNMNVFKNGSYNILEYIEKQNIDISTNNFNLDSPPSQNSFTSLLNDNI